MKNDISKEEALKSLELKECEFKQLPELLRDDKDIVLFAVAQTQSAFQYASDRLRNDKEVMLTAIIGSMPKSGKYTLTHSNGADGNAIKYLEKLIEEEDKNKVVKRKM